MSDLVNQYNFLDYSQLLGIPHIEVRGIEFNFVDLYEIVGREQFMTTFNLRKDCESFYKYGESVLGVIYYSPKILKQLGEESPENINGEGQTARGQVLNFEKSPRRGVRS